MKRKLILFISLIALLPLTVSAATKEEAKALAEKAATLINTEGFESARPKLEDKNGEYVNGALYVFAIDFEGNTLIHGGKPKLVGKNLIKMKDPNGVFFLKEMADLAKKDGTGWVKYHWANPKTNKVSPKITYVIKIKDKDALVGCGIYE